VIAFAAAGAATVDWWAIMLIEAPPLAQIAAYFMFFRGFRNSGRQLASARLMLERARNESAIHEAVAEAQLQWSASTVRSPFELLEQLADGAVLASDPETRRRCDLEESYLRQVSAIPFDLPFLSWWLARAVAEARRRSVRLQLRAEKPGIDDPHQADVFGRLLLDCVESSPSDTQLVVSMDDRAGTPRMFIVGDSAAGFVSHAQTHHSQILDVRHHELGDQAMLEATLIMSGCRVPAP